MKKYAIFIDLDGTLINETGVPPGNATAIAKAREAGHLVFVNSGRARSFINANLLGVIEFDGIISGMGSHIEIGGNTVFEKYIDVKKEDSIAIGDSSNDSDMLKNAGIAVAMGNASDELVEIINLRRRSKIQSKDERYCVFISNVLQYHSPRQRYRCKYQRSSASKSSA